MSVVAPSLVQDISVSHDTHDMSVVAPSRVQDISVSATLTQTAKVYL
jgi:hypothetical protein